MTTAEMRKEIRKCYSSKTWSDKVKKMPAKQVYAVYTKFKERGILGHKAKDVTPEYTQVSLFDLGLKY